MKKKFIIIEGRVVGGHTIRDLGITIDYEEKKTIDATRAAWSRDLNHSLQQKLVEKVKVITGDTPMHNYSRPQRTNPPRPKHTTRRQPSEEPSAPEATELPQVPEVSSEGLEGISARSEALLEKSLDENAQLRRMNEELMRSTNSLIEKLSEFMDKPPQVIVKGVAQGPEDFQSFVVEDDTPAFIPSQIRTGKGKTNKGVEVETGGGTSSESFDDAAKALAAMRKGKKRKDDDE